MLLGLLAALGSAAAFGVAAVLQAVAARKEPAAERLEAGLLVRMARQPVFLVAMALNFVGFLLHLAALRTLSLALAQAATSASIVVTAVLAARFLGARLRAREYAAVLAVCVGIAVLTQTAAESGEVSTSAWQRAGLLAVVALAAGVGAVVARARGVASAAGLGLVAGVAFAANAVASRVLPEITVVTVVTDPSTYALLAGSAVGFLTYATALQRASVVTATSTMILGQTVLPALVGVLLLGDHVRDGMLPLAVLGLALAVAGAVALARFDPAALQASTSPR